MSEAAHGNRNVRMLDRNVANSVYAPASQPSPQLYKAPITP